VLASRVVLDRPVRDADGDPLWSSDHYGVYSEVDVFGRGDAAPLRHAARQRARYGTTLTAADGRAYPPARRSSSRTHRVMERDARVGMAVHAVPPKPAIQIDVATHESLRALGYADPPPAP
jgi:hypothetical protein